MDLDDAEEQKAGDHLSDLGLASTLVQAQRSFFSTAT